jgi:phosphate transport system permease protein
MTNKKILKSRRNDRIAEWMIKVCGICVIVAVVWILVMISRVALPLFFAPRADAVVTRSLPESLRKAETMAVGVDETQQRLFAIDRTGMIHIIGLPGGDILESVPAPDRPASASLAGVDQTGRTAYNLFWNNGSITSLTITFNTSRSPEGATLVTHAIAADELAFPAESLAIKSFARKLEKGNLRVDLHADNSFRIVHQTVEKDFLGNEKSSVAAAAIKENISGNITSVALDQKGHYLYAGTSQGSVLRWDISSPGQPRLLETVSADSEKRPVTSLNTLLGDNSLAIGDDKGRLATWFPVTSAGTGEDKLLTHIHTLKQHQGAITAILPSPRDKSLASADNQGNIHIDHATSEKNLISLKSANQVALLAYSAQGNSLCALDVSGNYSVWKRDSPHPEISLGTLFGHVWYEGYEKPEYVWQSSAANDDFEPKMSLMPLIFGTIKATLFAMLFAVPLALLGALYTSQFMTPATKAYFKPAVEIMAAVPSVVIGFMAGLWLAPLIDKVVLAFFMSILIIPAMLLVLLFFWRLLKPRSPLGHKLLGNEFLVLIPVVLLGIYLSYYLGGLVEVRFFAGDFKQWLYSAMGVRYDQRNAMIIAIALGFAVIPIIFTIAEDAISNVPRNLSAASLALGASRWQTAWRVVLPSALPGVFSAVMIGFGRAVGETMIVLMATGNTPIMSWSIFNGLRTLSANIAVEIPEAPLNGSLYRTLFLSAVLLFIFTFIINTAAEALRERFRKKFGRY